MYGTCMWSSRRDLIFGSLGVKKIVVATRKLTNNFAGLITCSLVPDVARGPPVVHATIKYNDEFKSGSDFTILMC
jgi:hypothetical protein